MNMMKPGYLYVLVHPSDPDLYKIGQTTRQPEERLAEHNCNYETYTGQIVKETGQKWELKTSIVVPDPYWAEAVFWGATPLADIPFRRGIEVEKMEWKWVQAGLDAAKKAGIRPPNPPFPDRVYAYTRWMKKRLEGRDITLVGYVTSRSGKANFKCRNGHEWRTRSAYTAEGQGCPQCGIGNSKPEEIWQTAKLGYICLLTHPDNPGVIKIGLTYTRQEQWYAENLWGDWEMQHWRFTEEPVLAEAIIWELLGQPLPNDSKTITLNLGVAEEAFRHLIPRMHSEIALMERAKEHVQKID